MPAQGVVPDILVAAKAIGNGFPVGVTAISEAISGKIPAGAHGTTYGANPLASRAIVAEPSRPSCEMTRVLASLAPSAAGVHSV